MADVDGGDLALVLRDGSDLSECFGQPVAIGLQCRDERIGREANFAFRQCQFQGCDVGGGDGGATEVEQFESRESFERGELCAGDLGAVE